jgi:YVTN family beta-propeller protein
MTNDVVVKNWLVLSLENTSTNSQIVPLFQQPTDLSSGSGSSISPNPSVISNISITGLIANGIIAYNSTNNSMYVPNWTNGTVSVIDCATNTVTTTITVGTNPVGGIYVPSVNKLYIANEGTPSVSVIDCSNDTVIVELGVGLKPTPYMAVSLAQNKIYVASESSNNVTSIDLTINNVVSTIAVGSFTSRGAVRTDGAYVFFTQQSLQAIVVIDTATDIVSATTFLLATPSDIVHNPTKNSFYISTSSTTNLYELSDTTFLLTASVNILNQALTLVFDSSKNRVYVGATNNRIVAVNCVTNAVITTLVTSGAGVDFLLLVNESLYANNTSVVAKDVFDVNTGTSVQFNAQFFSSPTLSSTSNRIYSYGADTVSIVTIKNIIKNTLVSVVVENGMTYDALTQELNNGYYELTYANVYANNVSQANNYFKIDDRYISGKKYNNYDYPALLATANQFISSNVPLNFFPKSPKILYYKLNSLQSVRLIIKYRTILLDNDDLPDKKLIDSKLKYVQPVKRYLPISFREFIGENPINGLVKRTSLKGFFKKKTP